MKKIFSTIPALQIITIIKPRFTTYNHNRIWKANSAATNVKTNLDCNSTSRRIFLKKYCSPVALFTRRYCSRSDTVHDSALFTLIPSKLTWTPEYTDSETHVFRLWLLDLTLPLSLLELVVSDLHPIVSNWTRNVGIYAADRMTLI